MLTVSADDGQRSARYLRRLHPGRIGHGAVGVGQSLGPALAKLLEIGIVGRDAALLPVQAVARDRHHVERRPHRDVRADG